MKFVTSFHHVRNNLYEKEGRGGKNWTGHYEYVKKDFPSLLDNKENAILYGYLPREEFLQRWKGKLMEVIDNYQPGQLVLHPGPAYQIHQTYPALPGRYCQ